MQKNVEIKARLHDPAAVRSRAEALSGRKPESFRQRDTFFRTGKGRFKLRECRAGAAELIYYERPDDAGPCQSDYRRVPVPDAAGMREVLSDALGVCGEVEKTRTLYRTGQTRIHLDEVKDLGHFLEIEVVLDEGETFESGAAEALRIMAALGIHEDALVSEAYVDLLNTGKENGKFITAAGEAGGTGEPVFRMINETR